MGDILKAIYEDTNDYHQLCEFYKEEPQGSPYGPHAKQLEERWRKDGRPDLPEVETDISTLEKK